MITKINERGVKAYCDFLATFSLACIMYIVYTTGSGNITRKSCFTYKLDSYNIFWGGR